MYLPPVQYRHTIRQDLPFRLKRLHVWNVSGRTPSQTGNDPKLRLIKRLLRTGPVSLQETRWHKETPETLYHNIPGLQIAHTAGLPTERGGISGGAAVLIPPGWRVDRTEEIIPGRAVLAVMQDSKICEEEKMRIWECLQMSCKWVVFLFSPGPKEFFFCVLW